MQRPDTPDTDLAVYMLDLATRAWPHAADVVFAVAEALTVRGLPVAQLELHMRISHPLLAAVRAFWTPASGGSWAVHVRGEWVVERAEQREQGANPLYAAERSVRTEPALTDLLAPDQVARLEDTAVPLAAPVRVDLPGYTAALAAGIEYGAPVRSVLLLATRDPAGFSAPHALLFHTAAYGLPAISRASRWRALCHVLAQVYIGPQTGLKVLRGQLQRGDLERRSAVVWFSDLRGFTALSVTQGPEGVVARLNEVFEEVARAVTREGGEILKFIGDAVLAIFPYPSEDDAPEAVRRAVRAARACLANLPPDLSVGIGLHRGELAYGNIGASNRLDFTVIGTTVNLASRIESLTGKLGVSILASEGVASVDPDHWRSAGSYALKGIPGQTEVFTHR